MKGEYKCSDCGLTGHKLWRDYGYADELWCAACCDKRIAEAELKHPSDPWDEPPGPLDKMVYGFSGVAAIPSFPEDGNFEVFQSAGAYKVPGLLWWHALPTYQDERTEIRTVMAVMRTTWTSIGVHYRSLASQIRKINGLRMRLNQPLLAVPEDPTEQGYGYSHKIESAREVMLSHLATLFELQGRSLELYKEQGNLEWRLDRLVVEITKPAAVKIWGSKTEKLGEYYVTSPEEQVRTLKPGDRIAVGRTNTAVLIVDNEFTKSPSILDFDQDGGRLVKKLVGDGAAKVVDGRY